MFGYVTANGELLCEEDKKIYRACYCGLCKELKRKGRGLSLMTLNYDMAFLILILNSVYMDKTNISIEKCALHPFLEKECFFGEAVSYAADMNIILSGYKMKDDIKDENKISAKIGDKIIKKHFQEACLRNRKKAEAIKENLDKLSGMERNNIADPDMAAELFGNITGEMFSPYDDERRPKLYAFGKALGKFIYIMDACIDLKKDIKHKRYNPLVMYSSKDFKDMLNIFMADCTREYENLEIKKNKSLIENILFSGIWTKFEYMERKNR